MPPETNPPTRFWTIQPVILAAVALAVHLLVVTDTNRRPAFAIPVVDAASYHWQAVGIVQDPAPATRAFWQPPLYPYWLALVYAVATPSPATARAAQGLFLVLTVLLTFAIGKRLAGPRAAFVGALLLCFCGPLLLFTGMLLPNMLATMLDLVVVLTLLRLIETPSRGRAYLCGLAFGAAALAVPNVLFVLPVAAVWLIQRARHPGSWRTAVTLALAGAAGMLTCLAPVAVRNRAVSGEWVPISTNGGINLYIGNNPHADQTQALRPGEEWGRLVALPYEAGARTDRAADAFFYGKVRAYIRTDPLGFLSGLGTKALRFWNAREWPRNIDVDYACSLSPLLHPLAWRWHGFAFPFGLLGALGLFGLITTIRGHRDRQIVAAFVVCYALSVILFFPASRYRLPIIPPLMIFAVLGAEHLWTIGRQSGRVPWERAALLASLLVIVNLPLRAPTDAIRLDAELHTDVGVGLQTRHRPAEALAEYETALSLDPHFADALYYRGTVLRDLGRFDEAVASFRTCLAARPDHTRAMHDLALVLFEHLKAAAAAETLLRAVVAKEPANAQAMTNLAILLSKTGRKDEATEWLKRVKAPATSMEGGALAPLSEVEGSP